MVEVDPPRRHDQSTEDELSGCSYNMHADMVLDNCKKKDIFLKSERDS